MRAPDSRVRGSAVDVSRRGGDGMSKLSILGLTLLLAGGVMSVPELVRAGDDPIEIKVDRECIQVTSCVTWFVNSCNGGSGSCDRCTDALERWNCAGSQLLSPTCTSFTYPGQCGPVQHADCSPGGACINWGAGQGTCGDLTNCK